MQQAIPLIIPKILETANSVNTRPMKGRVKRIVGNMIYAQVPGGRLGEICELHDLASNVVTRAEIVGLDETVAMLSPLAELHGLSTSTEVLPTGKVLEVPVGHHLLGRVLDGFGCALDEAEKGPLPKMPTRPLYYGAPPALKRRTIDKPLSLGIRAIDGVLTSGEGQRVGIYGHPGTGKSLLLAQILKSTTADIRVIALVGERGREVREFVERHLTPEARARSVVVVATSDRSSVERIKAAHTAMAISEHFRDAGHRVLLVVDNITRLARALREVGLSAGEPPTRRGFPPSVFTVLPALFERAGMAETGSITALFSVLVEGDNNTDPIAEETRSLLDGHIVLSPKLAQSGHFPAVDVTASLSRVMIDVVSQKHQASAQKFRQLLAKYAEVEFLLQVGEYKSGSDKLADEAIAKKSAMDKFLRQGRAEPSGFDDSVKLLSMVVD